MEFYNQIPKVIHYCWFGGNPLPELALRCIESWRKYCPDYEIVEWNESNYDVNACDYVRDAYEAKKYAFVSDYARFDILYRYGGVYFDTDVEIIRSIDDILEKGPFLGVEQDAYGAGHILVAPGLGMAATKEMPIYGEILKQYEGMHFLNEDGSLNLTTVVSVTNNLLYSEGLKDIEEIQTVAGIHIYPWDYFCPMRYGTEEVTITENSRSIHHYSASWLTENERSELQFRIKMAKCFGEKLAAKLERVYSFPRRVRDKYRLLGFFGAVKFAIKKCLGLTNR